MLHRLRTAAAVLTAAALLLGGVVVCPCPPAYEAHECCQGTGEATWRAAGDDCCPADGAGMAADLAPTTVDGDFRVPPAAHGASAAGLVVAPVTRVRGHAPALLRPHPILRI